MEALLCAKKKMEKQTAASRTNGAKPKAPQNGRNGAEHRGLEPVNPGITESPRSSHADCEKTSLRREPSMMARSHMEISSKGKSISTNYPSSPSTSSGPLKFREAEGGFESSPAQTFGTSDGNLVAELFLQVIRALPTKEQLDPNGNYALAALHGIGPRDSIEGMLSTQFVADHNLTMEFLRRAALQGQLPGGVKFNTQSSPQAARGLSRDCQALGSSPACEFARMRGRDVSGTAHMSGARNACRRKGHEEFLTNPRE